MKRRSVLAGFAAVVSGGAIVGSGAFDSVDADRDASIGVVSEDDAYLQLETLETPPDPNGIYAATQESNKLWLDFNEVGNSDRGFGPNTDAEYTFDNVFGVRNTGSQTVYFWLEDIVNQVGDLPVENFALYVGDDETDVIDGEQGVAELPVGVQVKIGVKFETLDPIDGRDDPDMENTITLRADAEDPTQN